MNTARIVHRSACLLIVLFCGYMAVTSAQMVPSENEIAAYRGLHLAAIRDDLPMLKMLIAQGADLEARDSAGRTPLHVAAYASRYDIVRELIESGANANAFENQAYDIVTIAAVADDLQMLDLALDLGVSARNITSPYDGTALIAAAHLGHYTVVKRLIRAGAPLDHVNNLGWTALIEAVILGNGGHQHVETVRELVAAGADKTLVDRQGLTPLEHARANGYRQIVAVLEEIR